MISQRHIFLNISAIYLISVMAISMLSLFATVLVLTLHYHDPTAPVPSSIRKIFLPRYTVKDEPTENNKANNVTAEDEVVMSETEMKKLEENGNLSKAAALQITLLYNMWKEMKTTNCKESRVRYYDEWKVVAKRLDRVFLFLFLFLTILINVVLLSML